MAKKKSIKTMYLVTISACLNEEGSASIYYYAGIADKMTRLPDMTENIRGASIFENYYEANKVGLELLLMLLNEYGETYDAHFSVVIEKYNMKEEIYIDF